MQRIQAVVVALLASLGLAFASGSALAQKQDAPKDTKKTEASKDTKKAADTKSTDATKKGDLMDINSASEKELATLKGIGDVRAAAIVKGRPYKGKDDLVQKKIIPQSVYDGIKDQIIAKQNTAAAAPKADAKKK
jgi:competence protein ComEA